MLICCSVAPSAGSWVSVWPSDVALLVGTSTPSERAAVSVEKQIQRDQRRCCSTVGLVILNMEPLKIGFYENKPGFGSAAFCCWARLQCPRLGFGLTRRPLLA